MNRLLFIGVGVLVAVVGAMYPATGIAITLATAMVLSGSASYFAPSLAGVAWVGPIVAAALWVGGVAKGLSVGLGAIPRTLWLTLAFVLCGVLSVANNLTRPEEALVGAKVYFQYWGIPFALAYLNNGEKHVKWITGALLVVAVIQAPVAMLQHFVFVDYRFRLAPGDSIVGTFGGDPKGGGSSGAQTIFLACILGGLAAWLASGLLKWGTAALLGAMCAVPMLLNETKVTFVLLPVAALMLVYDYRKAHPLRALGAGIGVVGLGAVVGMYYFIHLQHGMAWERADSLGEYASRVRTAVTQMERPDERGLGRIATPLFWAKHNGIAEDPLKVLFGHGLGAAKASGLLVGHLNLDPRYANLGIGNTGIAALLWEVGVVGALVYLWVWFSAWRLAGDVMKRAATASDGRMWFAVGGAARASIVVLVAALGYDTYMFRNGALNFYGSLVIGLVLCANALALDRAAARGPATPEPSGAQREVGRAVAPTGRGALGRFRRGMHGSGA